MRLALPSIMGLSVSAFSQLLNTFFIGQLGTAALAAVSITFPLVLFMTSIGLCFGSGSASLIARKLGSNKKDEASYLAALGFRCAILTAIIITALGIIFSYQIISIFDASEETIHLSVIYFRWMLISHIILVGNMVCGFIVRAEGNTKLSMKTQLVAFTMNAIFDPIFIFWMDLGIQGAGVATLLSQVLAISIYMHYFLNNKSNINPLKRSISYSFDKMMNIIKIGSPAALNIIMGIIALALLNKFASQHGDTVLAGIGIASRLILIATLPINGLCIGSQSIIGYNIGAKNWNRVASALGKLIAVSLTFSALYAIIVLSNASTISSFFTQDPDVIAFGAMALQAFHLTFPFIAIQAVCLMFFQAKGESVKATIMALLRQGICLIPLLYIFHSLYGQEGLLYALPFSDLLAGLIALVLLAQQFLALRKEQYSTSMAKG